MAKGDDMLMKFLDLFCGAGGAAMGYYKAGFDHIVGVDIKPQKRYPFEFVQADALTYLQALIESGEVEDFDLIHASPPCQAYSVTRSLTNKAHPELIEPTRKLLLKSGRPYVIENVEFAPLVNPLKLCGTMFNLQVLRHRLFETSPLIYWPPRSCQHIGKATSTRSYSKTGNTTTPRLGNGFNYVTVAGSSFIAEEGRLAMGIDWMTTSELNQAIPPAYTQWLGKQLIEAIG